MLNKLKSVFPGRPAFLALSLLCLLCCDKKVEPVIITDDVLMLVVPAAGLETTTCADFISTRNFSVPPADSQSVSWTEGKSLFNDTLQIIRLEMLGDTGSLAQFTMTLRPKTNAPSEIQCMKGFGCDGPWTTFPWKSPDGNFLDHTVFKFRVVPRGKSRFVIQNYNAGNTLSVRVNPPI